MTTYIAHTNHPTYKTFGVVGYNNVKHAHAYAKQWAGLWMPGYHIWVHEAGEDDKPWADYKVAKLPFEGFYESRWSSMVDHEEESNIEYNDERQAEDGIDEHHLHYMDGSTYADIVQKYIDYSSAYHAIAKDYVGVFSAVASDEMGFKFDALGLAFENMDSPREYNFRTDTLYAHIHPLVLDHLLARSAIDHHESLNQIIERDFTSRSGFSSHYPNDLDAWLDKPFETWDHNEYGALIEAMCEYGDAMAWEIYERIDDGSSQYWSDCVDWAKVEADIQEYRDEKDKEARAEDPDYVPPPVRCDQTPDLFDVAA